MYNILLFTGVLVLIFVCVLAVLFILMQRPSSNAGMGSALGGAATESVFGGETASVLTKTTSVLITLFFLLCIGLYFAFVARSSQNEATANLTIKEDVPAQTESLYTDAEGKPLENVPAEKPTEAPAKTPAQ